MNKLTLALITSAFLSTPAFADDASPAKPTIVLAHGAFADGSSWDKVVPLLQAKGYDVVAVHQPLTSLADDAAATRRVIRAQTGDVILVGHSYGGVVITEAGTEEKVKALVYVAAFAPDADESINDLGKGAPPPPWLPTVGFDEAGFGFIPLDTVTKYFAQDLPGKEQKVLTAKQGWTAGKALADKVKTPAWKSKPVWYVRAAKDRFIDPGAQALMAKRMAAKVTTVDGSHVVMLSKPAQVAAVILEAATATTRTAKR
ncbi:MAG TPA: alpha/beta hydrolase [Kofleriaceae bacterium]|nr:alpha/beta hydrolase [Kofleriaceae bacterium]